MSSPIQGIPAPAVEAAPVTETPSQSVSSADPKLDIASKYERQLNKMRRELAETKKALEGYQSGYVPKSKFKEDPFTALAEVDLDYQKLTETVLNQPNLNDPTIKALTQRLQRMEQAEVERQKKAEQAEIERTEQGRKQLLNDAKLAVENSGEEFEFIKKWDAYDLVLAKLEESYNDESGDVMEIRDACKAVEEELLTEALKVYESPKLKNRIAAPTPGQEVAPTPTAAPVGDKPKWQNKAESYSVSPKNINTLTNRLTQEMPKAASSEQERIARAIAAIEGKLK